MKKKTIEFEMIKPFIEEFVTFIFVITGIFLGLLMGDFINITFRIHLFTMTVFIVIMCSLLSLFSRIVNMGVRVLIDFLLQSSLEDIYIFLKEEPYKASIFTEKINKERKRDIGIYYLIHVKKGDEVYTFISPKYVELLEGHMYKIKFGKHSKVFMTSYLMDS